MPIKLTRADFVDRIGETFIMSRDGFPTLNLTLNEAIDLRHPERKIPPQVRQDPFQLTFLGPFDPLLPQGLYTLTHEEMGSVDLFVIHGGPEGDQQLYNVTIN